MAKMKISTGPRYEKTGSPLRKQQRQVRELANSIFAEILSSARPNAKSKRVPLGESPVVEEVRQQ